MRLVNTEMNIEIDMDNSPILLVIECEERFAQMVQMLIDQVDKREGDFVLSENNKLLAMDKYCDIIMNPFSLDINDKKIQTKLYAKISGAAEVYFEEKERIHSEIVRLLDDVVDGLPLDNITYNLELDWNTILKMYSVKIGTEYTSITEKLVDYIKTCALLCETKVLILVNAKSYLNKSDLLNIYEMASYFHVHIMLVEAVAEHFLPEELVYILDKDDCFISTGNTIYT